MSQEVVNSVSKLTGETTKVLKLYTQGLATVGASKDAAVEAAKTATTKAAEAKDSALKAANSETKAAESAAAAKKISGLETVEAAVAAALANSYQYAMTRSEFQALCNTRKALFNGSGFVDFGAGHVKSVCINQGMWTAGKHLHLGKSGSSSTTYLLDATKSLYPDVLADGALVKIRASAYASSGLSRIILPDAPDGTQTYNSDTGLYEEHDSVSAAYEGVFADKAPERASGVTYLNGTATFSNVNANQKCNWTLPQVSTEMVFSFRVGAIPQGSLVVKAVDGRLVTDPALFSTQRFFAADEGKTIEFRFTPTADEWRIYVESSSSEETAYGTIEDLSLLPATESVVTSRKDLVFLEVWHEDVAKKGVLIPYGNTQCGMASWGGIATVNSTSLGIGQGYSAHGEWDTETVGYYIKIADMTDDQLQRFLSDPDNNCYFDPLANKLIQVRYRIRVVRGAGDAWESVLPAVNDYGSYIRYDRKCYVQCQGEVDSVTSLGPFLGSECFVSPRKPGVLLRGIKGQFSLEALNANRSHTGDVVALPIALVQRLNKGAYHPELNPFGTRAFKFTTDNNVAYWHEKLSLSGDYEPKHQKDCMVSFAIGEETYAPGAAAWTGNLDTTSSKPSGRADAYPYFDAIYPGQVQDLRVSANKKDHRLLLDTAQRMAVVGDMRGKESVPFSMFNPVKYVVKSVGSSGGGYYVGLETPGGNPVNTAALFSGVNDAGYCPEREHQMLYNVTKNVVYYPSRIEGEKSVIYLHSRPVAFSAYSSVGMFPASGASVGDEIMVIDAKLTSAEFDQVPYIEIIGNPENLAVTFPQGVVGRWVPVIPETGVNKTFPFYKKVNDPDAKRFFTLDNGATWKSSGYTLTIEENAYVTSLESEMVALHRHLTPSNMSIFSTPSRVVSGVGNVVISSDMNIGEGNRLQSSLIGNVGKNNYSPDRQIMLGTIKSGRLLTDGTVVSNTVTHAPVPFSAPMNNSKAVKALCSLTDKDGYLYLQLHGNELMYDQGSWGDSGSIYINGSQSHKLDDNGNRVKAVCHRSIFPVGLADNESYGV